MTPRSRKPVFLISGTNINKLPSAEKHCMNNVEEEEETENDSLETEPLPKKSKSSDASGASLTSTFQDYLCSRSMVTLTPTDHSFSSRTDDYDSADFKDVSESKLSSSLLYCLDGNVPEDVVKEKEPVLKPNQYDENGKPVVFETSF